MPWNDRGFTLVELIIIAGIFGLLLLVAAPRMDQMAAAGKLQSEAWKLAAVMRSARQDAIVSGQARTVIFYPDGRYRVYDQSQQSFTHYQLKSGVRLVGETTILQRYNDYPACTFTPLGVPVGPGTITLEGSDGCKRYIITNPVQGRIRISTTPPAR